MISTLVAAAAQKRIITNLPEWQLKVLKTDAFISGDELSSVLGITGGLTRYSDTDWLEVVNNKTGLVRIFPKQPLRYNIAVSQILPQTPSDGSKVVNVRGRSFRVQLMSTTEWDELMYSVCSGRPPGVVLAHQLAEFSQSQLGQGLDSKGVRNITRTLSGTAYVNRGANGDVRISATQAYGALSPQFAWRPLLTKV